MKTNSIHKMGVSATRTYILEGLDCANCAARVEAKLKEMDGVDDVSITFATRQMKLAARDPDAMIPQIQSLINTLATASTTRPCWPAPMSEPQWAAAPTPPLRPRTWCL